MLWGQNSESLYIFKRESEGKSGLGLIIMMVTLHFLSIPVMLQGIYKVGYSKVRHPWLCLSKTQDIIHVGCNDHGNFFLSRELSRKPNSRG